VSRSSRRLDDTTTKNPATKKAPRKYRMAMPTNSKDLP